MGRPRRAHYFTTTVPLWTSDFTPLIGNGRYSSLCPPPLLSKGSARHASSRKSLLSRTPSEFVAHLLGASAAPAPHWGSIVPRQW